RSKVLMILDGDQRKLRDYFVKDFTDISKKERKKMIEELRRLNVKIVGGEERLEEWAAWCKNHVLIIDETCAEEIFLRLISPDHRVFDKIDATNRQFKECLRQELNKLDYNRDAASMSAHFESYLNISPNAIVAQSRESLAERLSTAINDMDQ